MSASTITVEEVFNAQAETLGLEWVAARGAGGHQIDSEMVQKPSLALAGQLDFVYPNRLQVFGRAEITFLNKMDPERRAEVLEGLFAKGLSALMVSDSGQQHLPEELAAAAEEHETPLLLAHLSSPQLVHHLHHYLSRVLADRTTVHGVFLDVMGLGTLLTGPSGVGKSEVALELLTRGHHLIADDAPEFAAEVPGMLVGRSPELLRDHMEVRGLGILNIRQLFGPATIVASKRLRLIIHFKRVQGDDLSQIDRLQQEQDTQSILGVEIPRVVLPVSPGRNLAVMVEVAVQSYFHKASGFNPEKDFRERLRKRLIEDDRGGEWN
ncbi:HPr(Ser) kinase/phosphatase [Thiohalorhabdus methylotrophus]|uniref:HPr kinase/phosphorylase n=1 Tax=Thiohalorhabdus methylotrophus TaxID=3242694 RepID=A0ABV4TQY7_9GAMM